MTLKPLNSSSLEQLALKGLMREWVYVVKFREENRWFMMM